MTSMDQTQGLLAFVRSVQTGSFSAAARVLGVAPSAVSKAVARLEKRLGARLLQRSTRTLTPTEEGRAYYERVEPLMRALDEASDVVKAPDRVQGVLRVSAPAELGRGLALPVTRDFVPRHPGLRLEFSATDRPVDLVREGYDVAIRVGDAQDAELNARLLARLPLVLVASPAYLAGRGEVASIEDLDRHLHVRYVVNGRPQPIALADGRTVAPPAAFDTDSGDVLRTAALMGLGVIQILASSVQEELRTGALVPVLSERTELAMPAIPVHALHAFGRHTPARARVFIDFLVDWFKDGDPG